MNSVGHDQALLRAKRSQSVKSIDFFSTDQPLNILNVLVYSFREIVYRIDAFIKSIQLNK